MDLSYCILILSIALINPKNAFMVMFVHSFTSFPHCAHLYFFPNYCALLLSVIVHSCTSFPPLCTPLLLFLIVHSCTSFPLLCFTSFPPAFLSAPSCPIQLKGNKWKERAKEDRRPPEHNNGEDYDDDGCGGGGDDRGGGHGGDPYGDGDSVCRARERGDGHY